MTNTTAETCARLDRLPAQTEQFLSAIRAMKEHVTRTPQRTYMAEVFAQHRAQRERITYVSLEDCR